MALLACGTRTLFDAVLGPTTAGETTYAPRLLPSPRPGLIPPADHLEVTCEHLGVRAHPPCLAMTIWSWPFRREAVASPRRGLWPVKRISIPTGSPTRVVTSPMAGGRMVQ